MNYSSKNAIVSAAKDLTLGNAGIDEELKDAGYVATICASTTEDKFQDLHCTRQQLIDLRNKIDFFLKREPV